MATITPGYTFGSTEQVTNTKLASLAGGTVSGIVNADVAAGAAISYSKLSLSASVTGSDIATATIGSGNLAASAIVSAVIQGSAVGSSELKQTSLGNLIGAIPALTFTTASAQGAANTFVRTDATVKAIQRTGVTTLAFGGSASGGTADIGAAADHAHGMPVDPTQNFESIRGAGSVTVTAGSDGDGADVSVTLDVQSRVIVIVTGYVSAYSGTITPTFGLRRDGVEKVASKTLDALDDDVAMTWSETLAAGTYAWDLFRLAPGGFGSLTLTYIIQIMALPNT